MNVLSLAYLRKRKDDMTEINLFGPSFSFWKGRELSKNNLLTATLKRASFE